jgi:hypothetical protein
MNRCLRAFGSLVLLLIRAALEPIGEVIKKLWGKSPAALTLFGAIPVLFGTGWVAYLLFGSAQAELPVKDVRLRIELTAPAPGVAAEPIQIKRALLERLASLEIRDRAGNSAVLWPKAGTAGAHLVGATLTAAPTSICSQLAINLDHSNPTVPAYVISLQSRYAEPQVCQTVLRWYTSHGAEHEISLPGLGSLILRPREVYRGDILAGLNAEGYSGARLAGPMRWCTSNSTPEAALSTDQSLTDVSALSVASPEECFQRKMPPAPNAPGTALLCLRYTASPVAPSMDDAFGRFAATFRCIRCVFGCG